MGETLYNAGGRLLTYVQKGGRELINWITLERDLRSGSRIRTFVLGGGVSEKGVLGPWGLRKLNKAEIGLKRRGLFLPFYVKCGRKILI